MRKRLLCGLILILGTGANAQWLNYPTPGTPRTKDGKPNLFAPAPRTPDGKPDLSGIWYLRTFGRFHGNLAADLKEVPLQSSAESLYNNRLETFGADDPATRCLPSGVPRIYADPHPLKIVQLPALIIILHEALSYRQIFLDGRELPKRPKSGVDGLLGWALGG